ncbi:MAG: type III pantothenate kinase [Desulfohalobiaceae bacterium]
MSQSSEFLLLLDVGNTNIKVGVAWRGVLQSSLVLPTRLEFTSDTLGLQIFQVCNFLGLEPENCKAWVVSSVVPQLDPLLSQAGERFCAAEVLFVPKDLPLPLVNKYARPEEVGADRLVTAFAARQLYTQPGLIVVDFGTATTLECIQDQDYLGGLICPGVLSSLGALGGKTAKLPRIGLSLESTKLQIGISTATSMNQGFIFGFASMVDGLCQKLQQKLQGEIKILGTGGFATKIQPVCPCLQEVRNDLLLQGLLKAYYLEQLSVLGYQ